MMRWQQVWQHSLSDKRCSTQWLAQTVPFPLMAAPMCGSAYKHLPDHIVNSPAWVPVRQRRPSGVHVAQLMLLRVCSGAGPWGHRVSGR
jgi:hypothetical protein